MQKLVKALILQLWQSMSVCTSSGQRVKHPIKFETPASFKITLKGPLIVFDLFQVKYI